MFFRRKYKESVKAAPGFWTTILEWLHRSLLRLAQFLNRKTATCSPQRLKLGLFCFCTVSIGVCSLFIFQGMKQKGKATLDITTIKIMLPVRSDPEKAGLSEEEWRRILGFGRMLDSLDTTVEGKRLKDSLMKADPALLDSLHFLKGIFYQQNKK